ncbi:hypothetical protein [Microbacterium sp. Leaf320]|uniref:hypothetical protein n=1 Tax=Microbacterium sp. Leaf320 TaxID=1736334 RepID=UPI0006F6849E|nr:hypothetical protein [Microbacterium sp. Leaf320]KQQ65409.1 hypothetical protein ASF63_15855 [Microbacterium sp. Leaf320]
MTTTNALRHTPIHNGRPAWRRFHGPKEVRVTDNGDIVIDIRDMLDGEDASKKLQEWAAVRGFDLSGLDLNYAAAVLWVYTVNFAREEEPEDSPIHEDIHALYRREPSDVDLRIRVDGDYAAAVLTSVLEGRPIEPGEGTDHSSR